MVKKLSALILVSLLATHSIQARSEWDEWEQPAVVPQALQQKPKEKESTLYRLAKKYYKEVIAVSALAAGGFVWYQWGRKDEDKGKDPGTPTSTPSAPITQPLAQPPTHQPPEEPEPQPSGPEKSATHPPQEKDLQIEPTVEEGAKEKEIIPGTPLPQPPAHPDTPAPPTGQPGIEPAGPLFGADIKNITGRPEVNNDTFHITKDYPNVARKNTTYSVNDDKIYVSEIEKRAYGPIADPSEDRHLVAHLRDSNGREMTLLGVFDGHSGQRAADRASRTLTTHLATRLKQGLDPKEALRQAILDTDNQVVEHLNSVGPTLEEILLPAVNPARFTDQKNLYMDGTTANLVLMTKDKLYIANVGDCRALLTSGNKILFSSQDHNYESPEEIRRIKQARGVTDDNDAFLVGFDYDYASDTTIQKIGEPLNSFKSDRLKFVSTSRGIGERFYKVPPGTRVGDMVAEPTGVTAEADMYVIDRPEHGTLIVASDGLFEEKNNKEVLGVVQSEHTENIAKKLARDGAFGRDRNKDDVTVISYRW